MRHIWATYKLESRRRRDRERERGTERENTKNREREKERERERFQSKKIYYNTEPHKKNVGQRIHSSLPDTSL